MKTQNKNEMETRQELYNKGYLLTSNYKGGGGFKTYTITNINNGQIYLMTTKLKEVKEFNKSIR